ncbi:hypothetical protein [Schaalia suimastitidis]|nr:hypothetical protein [Schaalia suimastitidis]
MTSYFPSSFELMTYAGFDANAHSDWPKVRFRALHESQVIEQSTVGLCFE